MKFCLLLAEGRDSLSHGGNGLSEYDSFYADALASKREKFLLERDIIKQKDQKEWEKATTAQDLKATQKELDKALAYKEHLPSVCLEVRVSYAERVARRKEEVAALKEAYEILDKKR